jgi:hypothetical protein
MNAADFSELSEAEKKHFYQCSQCGEMVDRRQLDDVLFHETNHKPRPDIQYGGSVRMIPLPKYRMIRHSSRRAAFKSLSPGKGRK